MFKEHPLFPGLNQITEPLRHIWRRLPPRDPRFLLQNLDSEAQREKFLNQRAYHLFLEKEYAFWEREYSPENAQPAERAPASHTGSQPALAAYILDHPVIKTEM